MPAPELDDVAAPPAKPGKGPQKGAGVPGIKGWYERNETTVLIGGAGIVVAIALYVRSRSSASSSSSGTTAASSTTPESVTEPTTEYTGGGGGGGGNGYQSDILSALQTIETDVTPPSTTPTATTPAAAPSNLYTGSQVAVGEGYSLGGGSGPEGAYGSGTVEGDNGEYFSTSATAASSQALYSAGGAYYEPAVGDFAQVTSASQQAALEKSGTTEYAMVSPEAGGGQ